MRPNFLVRRVKPAIALIIGVALLQSSYPLQGDAYINLLLSGPFTLLGALGVINPAWTAGNIDISGGGGGGGD